MTAPDADLVNLSALIDDAKCFALVRQHRWPEGVRCPGCGSAAWSGTGTTTPSRSGSGIGARAARGASTTSPVRPENWRGPHHPVDPQGSMWECPVREPCPPKCCYPDMRRSNPTCEAPGTTATIWEHQSGGGLAEDEWLNASERPLSRSVTDSRPKVLMWTPQ